MIHENPGHTYRNAFSFRPPEENDYALHYEGRSALLIAGEWPRFSRVPDAMARAQYLFELDGECYYLVNELDCGGIEGAELVSIDTFRNTRPQHVGFVGITGSQLHRFYQGNRFCGGCGAPMQHSQTERALCCPACQNTIYPKISPAVIVAVTDGERLLLTKSAGRAQARYALVAGFCECGESLEETVRREVMEEVGLSVKNIRYFGSQPWSFSDTLLMGFYCDVDGDAEAHADGVELSEATWFSRGEIPAPESLVSLTATMIDAFMNGRENK